MSDFKINWDAVEQEAVALLSRYLKIDTTNPPGNETAGAEFLRELLSAEQIRSDVLESLPGRGSLVSEYAGSGPCADIVLLHHIDVVPAEKKKWSRDPFSGRVLDGEVWGRGALDCKSLGIVELMAFVLLKREGLCPEKHIVYAATADEEAGGALGVPWIFEHHPDRLTARFVINEGVGWGFSTAGGNLYLCQTAEKAACWVRIHFQGSPGHASLPHEDNCVVSMAKAVGGLAGHRFPVFVSEHAEKLIQGLAPVQGFMPPGDFLELLSPTGYEAALEKIPVQNLRRMISAALKNTMVPTVVSAGSKTNVIPSEGRVEVDCRILPGFEAGQLVETIREILTSSGCRGFEIELKGSPRASKSPLDTPLYEALVRNFKKHDSLAQVVPYMSPGATDSRFFRERGIPAYGVQFDASIEATEMIHGHDERIGIVQVTRGIKVLYDTLREFCV